MIQKRKMLIGDDKNINRYVLKGIFEDEYEIIECKTGEEVLEQLIENKDDIAVILLDLVMPDGDGFYVLDSMRDNQTEDVPVVVITANLDDEIIRKTYSYHIADYIQKPFQEDVVRQRVACVMKRYNNQVQLDARFA